MSVKPIKFQEVPSLDHSRVGEISVHVGLLAAHSTVIFVYPSVEIDFEYNVPSLLFLMGDNANPPPEAPEYPKDTGASVEFVHGSDPGELQPVGKVVPVPKFSE